MPRLSVILPNYNHADDLPRALDALLAQSRPADEVIVVDDGSTDRSWDVLARYAADHPSVKPLRHETNRGVPACAATALQACTGDWVYGAASDDAVEPGWFASAMAMVERYPTAGVVLGDVIAAYDDHRGDERQRLPQWDGQAPLYVAPQRFRDEHLAVDGAGFSLGASAIYRRDAIDGAGGFQPALGPWCDTFLTRVLALQHGAIYVNRPAVRWTASAHSYSHRDNHDGSRMKLIGASAAALMRGRFAELFDEEEVRRFEVRWMLEMAGGYERVSDTLTPRKLRDVRRAYADLSRDGRWFDRLLGGVLRLMFSASDGRRERRAEPQTASGSRDTARPHAPSVELPAAEPAAIRATP